MEVVHQNAILEGAKCEVYTRKELFKGLQKDPITAKPMIKYELKKNCSVEITKEHKLELEEDIKLRDNLHVYRAVGTKFRAESMSLYVDQKLPLKVCVKEGATATHGGHFMSTNKRTIGVIKYQHSNLRLKEGNDIEIKQIK